MSQRKMRVQASDQSKLLPPPRIVDSWPQPESQSIQEEPTVTKAQLWTVFLLMVAFAFARTAIFVQVRRTFSNFSLFLALCNSLGSKRFHRGDRGLGRSEHCTSVFYLLRGMSYCMNRSFLFHLLPFLFKYLELLFANFYFSPSSLYALSYFFPLGISRAGPFSLLFRHLSRQTSCKSLADRKASSLAPASESSARGFVSWPRGSTARDLFFGDP
jgi:hypothetical protein